MKVASRKPTITLSTLALLLIPSPAAWSIPDSIGNFFINPAGARLEDAANRPAMWQRNAEVKGDWQPWRDASVQDTSLEVQKLAMRAIVFGIEASDVTVQKRDDQPVRFVVRFEPDARDADSGRMLRQLIANINAWSGASLSPEQPVAEAEYLSIRLAAPTGEPLRVTLEPRVGR